MTEDKRVDDALTSNAQSYRLIIDSIPGLVVTTTASGELELVNQHVLEYTGRTFGELRTWAIGDAAHPQDVSRVRAAWKASIDTGEPYDIEYRIRRADGEYRWFHVRALPQRDTQGRIIRWHALFSDVDVLKRAEEALRKSEERWRAVFDNSAIGVALTDQSGRFLATNSAFQRMLGYTAEEICGLTFLEITHEDYRESNWQLVTELLEGERTQFQIEKQYRRKDGSLIWVSNNVSLVPGTKSMSRFLMALSEDITERKNTETTLRKTQAELAHVTRVASLGEMTASIAHEVNQPLAAVVNSTSACLSWLESQKLEEARRSASRAIAESHRASAIIGRIRALAKKAPPQKDRLDVNQTIHEVVALARGELQRNSVALETRLSESVPFVLADRVQLQQVILNLMMNAIEAMDGTGPGPRELVIRSGADESGHVVISVQDSGPGFNPDSLDHLFEAFYTTKPQGLGMGLAISRSIIAAHGGRLWATANTPRGAVFQFTLPIGG